MAVIRRCPKCKGILLSDKVVTHSQVVKWLLGISKEYSITAFVCKKCKYAEDLERKEITALEQKDVK